MTEYILTEEEKEKLIRKYNGRSFKDLRPDLAEQWHPTKNGDLTPEMVSEYSNREVYWLLSYDDPVTGAHFDFEWPARVRKRSYGQGCPYLTGTAVLTGFNDLATVNPNLAKQWHPTLNGDLTPESVRAYSGKKVYWIYPYDDPVTGKHFDFEWGANIANRMRDKSCPFLTGRDVWVGYNDFATVEPELTKQWHPTKNGDLTPENVTVCSNKTVWWFYPYDDPVTGEHFDFEWEAEIPNRVRDRGCPFLSGRAVWPGYNDLATLRPDITKEWHPTKNGTLTPEQVTCSSNKNVWWCCDKGHEWPTRVYDRTSGEGCPRCKSSKGESRLSTFCEEYGIMSQGQYKFDDCVHKRRLPFDRAIFHKNGELAFVVEYDGEQHFKPVNFSRRGDSNAKFEEVRLRDRIKNEYCREKRIPLVRISYKDFDNIEKILLKKMVRHRVI